MLTDRILALIAALSMIGFVSFLPIWVPSPDLIIVVVAVVLLMLYDFWTDLRPRRNGNGR